MNGPMYDIHTMYISRLPYSYNVEFRHMLQVFCSPMVKASAPSGGCVWVLPQGSYLNIALRKAGDVGSSPTRD